MVLHLYKNYILYAALKGDLNMNIDVKDKLDKNQACSCKSCRRKNILKYPVISEISGLFYARCPNCDKHDPYDFLGITRKAAIANWNDTMAHNEYNIDE